MSSVLPNKVRSYGHFCIKENVGYIYADHSEIAVTIKLKRTFVCFCIRYATAAFTEEPLNLFKPIP